MKLEVNYTSPTGTQVFTHDQPSSNSPSQQSSVEQKTAHLSALRTGIKEIQASVNTFLTEQMEHDRAQDDTAGNKRSKKDDEQAEKMYGEEDTEAE